MADPKFGPWIGWNGGKCPVAPDARVHVAFRDYGAAPDVRPASHYNWAAPTNIIAYREIIEPVRETVTRYCGVDEYGALWFTAGAQIDAKGKLTVETLDGVPDWSTLRGENL